MPVRSELERLLFREEKGLVLRGMGGLGVLGMRYDPEYGGGGRDTMASVLLAEKLGRSTFGGFSATVLVHTDMASPHFVDLMFAENGAKLLSASGDSQSTTMLGPSLRLWSPWTGSC